MLFRSGVERQGMVGHDGLVGGDAGQDPLLSAAPEFYSVRTVNGSVISLISRNSYKNLVGISIERVQRVNDYTFLEVSGK